MREEQKPNATYIYPTTPQKKNREELHSFLEKTRQICHQSVSTS